MTNRSRPTRSGPALRTLLAILSLAYLGSGTFLAAQVGSGLNATETMTQISGTTGTDTLWADQGVERWEMNNHATGVIPVAAWPCAHAGCIPYAAATSVSGIFPETELPIGATGVPLLVSGGIPQWGSVNLSSVMSLSNATGAKLATATGTLITSQPAAWDASGNLVALRGALGTTSSSDTISAAGTFTTTQTVAHAGLAQGSFIQVRAHGVFTTDNTHTNPLFNLQINAGGSPGICPAAGTAFTLNMNFTSAYWDATCYILLNGSGSAVAWGTFQWAGSTGGSPSVKAFANTGAITFDTTADHTVAVQETATLVGGQGFTLQALVVSVSY